MTELVKNWYSPKSKEDYYELHKNLLSDNEYKCILDLIKTLDGDNILIAITMYNSIING